MNAVAGSSAATAVPRCSFVAAFIERNPEFAELVDQSHPS